MPITPSVFSDAPVIKDRGNKNKRIYIKVSQNSFARCRSSSVQYWGQRSLLCPHAAPLPSVRPLAFRFPSLPLPLLFPFIPFPPAPRHISLPASMTPGILSVGLSAWVYLLAYLLTVSVCLCLYVSLSDCLSANLSVSVSLSAYVSLSVCISTCLCLSLSVSACVSMNVCLSVYVFSPGRLKSNKM